MTYLNPTQHIYTAITDNGESDALIGSIHHDEAESYAQLKYLTPASALENSDTSLRLLEHLVAQAKKWRTFQVLGEIEENSSLFEPLRQSGFSVYGRQRIWDLSNIIFSDDAISFWRKRNAVDTIAIQSLQRQIVPPLLQQVENFANSERGLICANDEIMAYIDVIYGTRGIFLRPLIHPNADNVREKLLSLLAQDLPNRRERPIYLCVRSYQAWIEPILEEMGATVGPRQVVMVKHLVSVQRTEKTVPANADTAWANPAAPIRSAEFHKENPS
ncbi:MAG: hypothetical protein HN391_01275 [Anaerolineae bacterium]|nr:hypothetical protein [Anaerolineae bacterium]